MSAAVSRQDDTELLVELLTPKSGPGSPHVRRPGSFRRSRNSPCASPSIAAERELSAFLRMTTLNSKIALEQERKVPSASAQPPETQAQSPRAVRTYSPHPQTSAQDKHHATTSYLSNNSSQARCDMLSPSNVDKPTSSVNQHSDHVNNSNDLPGYHEVQPAETGQTEGLVQKVGEENIEDKLVVGGLTTNSMSVVLEKRSLVPQLKAFDIIGERPYSSRSRHHGLDQDDLVVTNLDEPVEQIQNEGNNNLEGRPVQNLPSGRTEEEEREDKVMVWCVTGVCEIAADLTHPENSDTQTATENQGSSPKTPAKENLVPAPISNQPVPSTSHFDDAPPPSAEPASEPDQVPVPTRRGSAGVADQKEPTRVSTSKTREADAVTAKSVSPGPKSSSSHRGTKSFVSASTMKESPTSKTQKAEAKAANSTHAGIKSRAVRTLTTSENQGMRRVVPISRSSKGATSQVKHLEKPLGSHRSSSGATISTNSSSSASHRQVERPSTAPSSRRSSFNKVFDAKEKEPKVSGVRSHNQDLRKPTSVRKPPAKPVAKPEEKMCRTTLRALSQRGGAGGSVSAPSTPLHKAAGSSSLPGFARSTASFSFRRTQTALPPSKAASDFSSKPLHPKTTTTSPVAPPSRSHRGSLRVSQSSHSQNSSSPGTNLRLPSSRVPAHSPHPDLLVIPKGHRRNDSGTLSDKSTHSQSESAKSIKPSWR